MKYEMKQISCTFIMLNSDTSFDLTQTVTECLSYAYNKICAHYWLHIIIYLFIDYAEAAKHTDIQTYKT